MIHQWDRNPIVQIFNLDVSLFASKFENIICEKEDTEFLTQC